MSLEEEVVFEKSHSAKEGLENGTTVEERYGKHVSLERKLDGK